MGKRKSVFKRRWVPTRKVKQAKQGKSQLIFHGTIIHSESVAELQVCEDSYLGVEIEGEGAERKGVIKFLSEAIPEEVQQEWVGATLVELGKKLLIPGFIDTHVHGPQYPFAGTGRIPLLEWLKQYAFPTEQRFVDDEFARSSYEKAAIRHLKNGSTTCCYFSTLHLSASLIFVDVLKQLGQRAFVGKVNMDQNSPDSYIESTEQSIEDTRAFVQQVLADECFLITPIITPRFAPTCSMKLLKELGRIAAANNLPIQSHISENKDEVKWVEELFPDERGYAAVYDAAKLLTDRTIMAHGIHLTAEERKLFKARGSGVSHCPNSNFSLSSGILNLRQLMQEQIKVGLGTDVAGGYSPSMLDAIRQMIIAARARDSIAKDNNEWDSSSSVIDFAEGFYLATLGGAQLMGIDNVVGNFVIGKEFDALVVDLEVPNSPIDLFDSDSVLDHFKKFIFNGDDRNITAVYVAGKCVVGAGY